MSAQQTDQNHHHHHHHQQTSATPATPVTPATQPSSPSVPQIRSRITVVCGECKRLKLKCDRRTPCGSCLKRETTSRCIYSPAAAEKVDLHSLNNRLLAVEAQISLMSSYQMPLVPSNSLGSASASTSSLSLHARHDPPRDPAMALNYMRNLILDELKIPRVKADPDDAPCTISPSHGSSSSSGAVDNHHHQQLEQQQQQQQSHPAPPELYLPSLPPAFISDVLPPFDPHTIETTAQTLRIHTSLDWRAWQARIHGVYIWAASPSPHHHASEEARARLSFFPPSAHDGGAGGGAGGEAPIPEVPTRAFLALSLAAFALTALSSSTYSSSPHERGGSRHRQANESCLIPDGGLTRPKPHASSSSSSSTEAWGVSRPMDMLTLARQSAELAGDNNIEQLEALVVIVICDMLCDSPGKAFDDLGTLVNKARRLGLASDDGDPRERRKRVWCDVLWLDLLVSDKIGQPPLITDESTTTTTLTIRAEAQDGEWLQIRSRFTRLLKRARLTDVSSVEIAAGIETQIQTWLNNLPPHYRIPTDEDVPAQQQEQQQEQQHAMYPNPQPLARHAPPPDADMPTAISPALLLSLRRVQLSLIAQAFLLRLYIPHLPTHQATGGTLNAAHSLITTLRFLPLRPTTRAFSRRTLELAAGFVRAREVLVDAAAFCAHNIVRRPRDVWAKTALEDVRCAAEMLREIGKTAGSGAGGGGGESEEEREERELVVVVDALVARAEAARTGGGGGGGGGTPVVFASGSRLPASSGPAGGPGKRKRDGGDPVEDEYPHYRIPSSSSGSLEYMSPLRLQTQQQASPAVGGGSSNSHGPSIITPTTLAKAEINTSDNITLGRPKSGSVSSGSSSTSGKSQASNRSVRLRNGQQGGPSVEARHRSASAKGSQVGSPIVGGGSGGGGDGDENAPSGALGYPMVLSQPQQQQPVEVHEQQRQQQQQGQMLPGSSMFALPPQIAQQPQQLFNPQIQTSYHPPHPHALHHHQQQSATPLASPAVESPLSATDARRPYGGRRVSQNQGYGHSPRTPPSFGPGPGSAMSMSPTSASAPPTAYGDVGAGMHISPQGYAAYQRDALPPHAQAQQQPSGPPPSSYGPGGNAAPAPDTANGGGGYFSVPPPQEPGSSGFETSGYGPPPTQGGLVGLGIGAYGGPGAGSGKAGGVMDMHSAAAPPPPAYAQHEPSSSAPTRAHGGWGAPAPGSVDPTAAAAARAREYWGHHQHPHQQQYYSPS